MSVLILISLCGLPVQAREIDPDIQTKVVAANNEAISVMKKYAQNPVYDRNTRRIAIRMAELLTKAGIGPAVGKVANKCNANPKMVGAGEFKSQNIWLCSYAFSLDQSALTQVLIHESYHLYEGADYYRLHNPELYKRFLSNGFEMTSEEVNDSETRAAGIEFEITMKIYGCIFFKSGYFEPLLHLSENGNYTMCK